MTVVVVSAEDGVVVASDAGETVPEPQVFVSDSSAVWACAGPPRVIARVREAFEAQDSSDPGWLGRAGSENDLRERVAAVVVPAFAACARDRAGRGAGAVEKTTLLLGAHLPSGPCAVILYGKGFSEVLSAESFATGVGDLAASALLRQFAGTHQTVLQAQVVAWAAVRQAIAWTPQLQEPISLALAQRAEQRSAARRVDDCELYEIGAAAELWLERQTRAMSGAPEVDQSEEADDQPPRPPH
jgi:hypothetical protein